MRIRAIRGRGLASLADAFEVDLDAAPMRGCGVFVIGGPTGAGKSTILDAMCLALFGRAPRLARVPPRDVIRAGLPAHDRSDDAAARGRTQDDVVREAIRASDPRSLVRRGARHAFAEVDFEGRRGGVFRARWEVRSVQRRAGGWALGKPSMSLVSLARGVSADALVGSGADVRVGTTKTDVLAQIEARLGLDFGQFCRSVLLPQGELASFLEAPDDERARLLERVTGTEIYSTLSRVVYARATALAREARDRNVELAAVTLLSEGERDERVARRDEARLESARASKRAVELLAIERAHDAARVLADQLAHAERELDDLSRQGALWEPRRTEIDRARRAREVRVERHASRRVASELAHVEAELASLDARVDAIAPERQRLSIELETARGTLAALEEHAPALEAELVVHERALAAVSERSGRDEAQRVARRAAEAMHEDAARREREARKAADAFERELATVDQQAAADREASARGPKAIEPLAELVRRELREGAPCPVCGSPDHPALASGPLGRSAPSKRAAHDVLDALEARQRREARHATLRLETSRAQATAAARREELGRARDQLELARAEAERSAEERARIRASVERDHGVEPPASRRAAHVKRLAAARTRVGVLERDTLERASLAAHLLGQRDALRVRVETLTAESRRSEEALVAALSAQGLDATDLARAEQMEDRELARWIAELDRLDRQRDEQRAIVEERRQRLREAEEAIPAGLPARDEIEATRRDAERARIEAEQIAAIEQSRLAEDATRRAERDARREALGSLETEARTWESLSRLVGSSDGKKLRVLVQSMALDILLAHANQQLRALAPRYQLARRGAASASAVGSLALDVVDADLEGGPRATSSLSGGERFLVSLALALGLGTMTAERDDVGSLFLDEGFGSLDEESLEQALEALDALRQAGRQIGVVSHVARLSERFEVRVEVRPSAPGASTVHVTTT